MEDGGVLGKVSMTGQVGRFLIATTSKTNAKGPSTIHMKR